MAEAKGSKDSLLAQKDSPNPAKDWAPTFHIVKEVE